MRINKTTWKEEFRKDPADRINVVIGDDKQKDFKPQVKLERWDNEVNTSIRLITNEKGELKENQVLRRAKKRGLKWEAGKIDCEFYPVEPDGDMREGGYELEVILKEKPQKNVIDFSLETKGVDFHYQSFELGNFGKISLERPDIIKGSYAIYSYESRINKEGGKKYRAGKVGHIYRPKIFDSAGKEVWGDLNINGSVLSITVPQSFLNSATYPVIIDPTIGYDVVGATFAVADFPVMLGPIKESMVTTDEEGGAVSKISFYGGAESSSLELRAAIYTRSTDNAILLEPASESSEIGTTDEGWHDTYLASGPVLDGNSGYSPVFFWNSGPDNRIAVQCDEFDNIDTAIRYQNISYPNLLSPLDWDGWLVSGETSTALTASIYAVYGEDYFAPHRVIRLRGGIRLLGNIRLR